MLKTDIIKFVYCESPCVKIIFFAGHGNHKYSLKLYNFTWQSYKKTFFFKHMLPYIQRRFSLETS